MVEILYKVLSAEHTEHYFLPLPTEGRLVVAISYKIFSAKLNMLELEFYILATSKVISGWILTLDCPFLISTS